MKTPPPLPPHLRRKKSPAITERRTLRSNNTEEALVLAFDRAVARGQLDAILITDDHGQLISKSRSELDLDLFAAMTPILARGTAKAKVCRRGVERDFQISTLEFSGERLHVAAIGGKDHQIRTRELTHSLHAAARILAA